MAEPLDPKPPREDLTDRECVKLIGACLGGLVQMANIDDVRRAVRWWFETDEAWTYLAQMDAAARLATGTPPRRG